MTRMIAGLGNPGPEYEKTRHNAGFLVVDLLGENFRASYWKDEAGALTAVVRMGDEDIVLCKPQTFMNLSGKAIVRLLDRYDVAIEDLIVVHDEIDLGPETVRVKKDGGHGGHNGLRSLHDSLDSDAYQRVRMGVGRPPGRMEAADYVLQPLKGTSWDDFESMIPTGAQAVLHVLEHGIDSAMQEFNAKE